MSRAYRLQVRVRHSSKITDKIIKAPLTTFLAVVLALPFYAIVSAMSDTTAPTLNSLSLNSSANLDITNSSAAANFTADISDDLSGFNNATLSYTSPSGAQKASDGTFSPGNFTTAVLFPQYAESGVWLPSLTMIDNSGNSQTLNDEALKAQGINIDITISGTSDTTAPTLNSLSLNSSANLDITNSSAAANFTADISDDLSGFNNATLNYVSPSGKQTASAGTFSPGNFTTAVLFPQYAESGVWTPVLKLSDNVGNTAVFDSTQLQNMGINIPITISGTSDTSAPTINTLSFSVAHPAVEAPLGGAVVTLNGSFSDNLSGFNSALIKYTSPNGNQTTESDFNINSNGDFQSSVTVPSFAQSGTWMPQVTLTDNAGNSTVLNDSALKAQGASLDFNVFKIVSKTLAPGETLSSDEENDGTTANDPIEAAVTTPSGGATSISLISSDAITDQSNGYTFFGHQITIVAPHETTSSPLTINFQLDPSLVPAGQNASTLQVSKNGELIPACTDQTTATPDPCVFSRVDTANGGISVSIHSTSASVWASGFPTQKFNWQGFKGSVKNPPVLNKAGAGSNMDVQFSLGGDNGLKILAAGSPSSQQISCTTLVSTGGNVATNTDKNGLTYDKGSKQYHYHWLTDKSWKKTCREFDITLSDGSVHPAYVQFN